MSVELSGEGYVTYENETSQNNELSVEETSIRAVGKIGSDVPFAAAVLIDKRANFVVEEITATNFDTEVSLGGLLQGNIEAFIIAAGSGEKFGFGDPTSTDLDSVGALEELLKNNSEKSQDQLVSLLINKTVEATASNDSAITQEFNLTETFLELDIIAGNFKTDEKIPVRGEINRRSKDALLSISFVLDKNDNTVKRGVIESWEKPGQFSAEFTLSSESNPNPDDGTYIVVVEAPNVARSTDFSVVDKTTEGKQTAESQGDTETAENLAEANSPEEESSSTEPVEDDTFTGITQLNRDVYFQNLDFEIEIGENSYWKILDLKITRDQYQTSGAVELLALPDPNRNPNAVPYSGDEIKINAGPTQAVADAGKRTKEVDGELERLFTGFLSNVQKKGDGSWRITAFTSQLDIVKTDINFRVLGFITVAEAFEQIVNRVSDKIGEPIDKTIDLGSEQEGEKIYANQLSSLGPDTTVVEDSFVPSARGPIADSVLAENGQDIDISKTVTDVKAKALIDDLARASNSVFWVDKKNTLQFGRTKSKRHKLDFVIESDARIQTPPYRSVKVVGDDVSQGTGAESIEFESKLIGDDTLTESESLLQRNDGSYAIKTGELREPTYVYKDESIRTRTEARNVARDLLEEINDERAEGKITIPGRPMLDIFDVIEVPNSFAISQDGTQQQAAQYLVKELIHRVNPSDGFVTEITVGGLVNTFTGPVYKYISETVNGFPKVKRVDPDEQVSSNGRNIFQEQTVDDGERAFTSSGSDSDSGSSDSAGSTSTDPVEEGDFDSSGRDVTTEPTDDDSTGVSGGIEDNTS